MLPKNKIFIDRVRTKIVNGSSDANSLSIALVQDIDNILSTIESYTERVDLLLNLKALKQGINNFDVMYFSDFFEHVEFRIKLEDANNQKENGIKLMAIPTKATANEILEFWLKLTGNNEKGEPYWESKAEIKKFVHQNFDLFPGVDEIEVFNPNMTKSELSHVTWTFYHNYGMSKTKKQYEKLLMQNFKKFESDGHVYSNIKDQLNEHLKKLLK